MHTDLDENNALSIRDNSLVLDESVPISISTHISEDSDTNSRENFSTCPYERSYGSSSVQYPLFKVTKTSESK